VSPAAARATACLNNQKQIVLGGLLRYSDEFDGFACPHSVAGSLMLNLDPAWPTSVCGGTWHSPFFIGQYFGNTKAQWNTVGYKVHNDHKSLQCPQQCAQQAVTQLGMYYSGAQYGMSAYFPQVGSQADYTSKIYRLTRLQDSSRELAFVDTFGYYYFRTGDWLPSNGTAWGISYVKRHTGGTNVAFPDGHARQFGDLRAAAKEGVVLYSGPKW